MRDLEDCKRLIREQWGIDPPSHIGRSIGMSAEAVRKLAKEMKLQKVNFKGNRWLNEDKIPGKIGEWPNVVIKFEDVKLRKRYVRIR